MNKQLSLNNVFLLTLTGLILFLITAVCVTPAQAATTEEVVSSTTAPVVLAWYYVGGPRYYRGPGWAGRGWVGPGRAYICPKRCWRNAWGYVNCARAC